MRTLIIWFVIGLTLYLAAKNFLSTEPAKTGGMAVLGQNKCDSAGFPGNGETRVLDPSQMRRSDALYSGLEIDNQHRQPVFVYLTAPGSDNRLLGLAVAAGQKAEASVPVGRYGVLIFSGTSWCNEQVGFSDGHRAKLQEDIEVPSGKTMVLALKAGEPAAAQPFQLVASLRLPQAPETLHQPPEATGPGYVDLRQMPDGHYYVNAVLNGAPVNFLLDTGASITSVSPEVAAQAGLHTCSQYTFQTANGAVQGCIARGAEMTFGGFRVRDIEVVIMPNLGGKALLGMNVLGKFRIEQQNGTMRLAVR